MLANRDKKMMRALHKTSAAVALFALALSLGSCVSELEVGTEVHSESGVDDYYGDGDFVDLVDQTELDLEIIVAAAFGNVLVVVGFDILSIPEPANNFYQVRIEMESGVTSSGYMEMLSRTDSIIRMRIRQDVFEWRESGPSSPLVEAKNMRKLVAISPIEGIDVKIIHPGSTFEPAPGG